MQKKLIALAVAGLVSAPAFAQSNVTVYGVADVFMGSFSGKQIDGVTGQTKTGRSNRVDSGGLSGSRIGFRGTEDLGNGLKAVFTLEYGIDIDSNTGVGGGTPNARQQFVGLAGNFGTVVAGRLQSPGFDFSAKYDAFAGASFGHKAALTGSQNATIHAGGASRVTNAVAYISPNLAGFTVKAAYAFGEQDDVNIAAANDNNRTSIMALSADYDNGPLSVGVVYHRLSELATARNFAGDAQREWAVGAAYDFGVVKPVMSYQRLKADAAAAGVRNYSSKIWMVGAIVPVSSAGNVHVGYSRLNGSDANAAVDNKANSWSLGYTHGLSKRTTVYAGYTRVSADDGFVNTAARNTDTGATFGGLNLLSNQKYSGFLAGLRHTF